MIVKKITANYLVQGGAGADNGPFQLVLNQDVYDCVARTIAHLDPNTSQAVNTQPAALPQLDWMKQREADLSSPAHASAYRFLGFDYEY